jgi:hypothetical protein
MTKLLDRNEAQELINKLQKEEGDFIRRFWDLSGEFYSVEEALKSKKIRRAARIMKKAHTVFQDIWGELRDRGSLGSYMYYPGPRGPRHPDNHRKPVFIEPVIIIRKHKIAW